MTDQIYSHAAFKHTYPIEPLEYVPCPLCDVKDDYLLAEIGLHGIPVRNVICKGCGLIRIDPRMTKENYELFYKEDFFSYLNPYVRPAYVEEIAYTTDDTVPTYTKTQFLPYVLPYVKERGRLLDVGAGLGQVVYLLRKHRRVSFVGLEPDPSSREVARTKMGVDLTDMTVEQYLHGAHGEIFDFIVLDQVFEHLLGPLEVLKGLQNILGPEGVIYIGVPNTYDIRVSMSMFYQIAHTYNYTPHTMRLLAEKAGLKVISVRSIETNALEVLLAHEDASYPAESEELLRVGSDWREVVRRLARKRRLNMIRGLAKRVVTAILGERVKSALQRTVDSLIEYRY